MPRAMGRLTPNPVKHLDPVGTILIFLVGFGWGKPVEFRPQALSSQRFGAAIVALAGPLMNLLLAFVAIRVMVQVGEGHPRSIVLILFFFYQVNSLLAVYNLISRWGQWFNVRGVGVQVQRKRVGPAYRARR